jgi:AcrB/AcrD/AcrF family protein
MSSPRWIWLALVCACRSRVEPPPSPGIDVVIAEPGASATAMVATVTAPLERALGSGASSRTTAGQTEVELADIADLAAAERAIAATRLPADAAQPIVRRHDPIARYVIEDLHMNAEQLAGSTRHIASAIASTPGVASVVTCGKVEPVVWVDVDADRLSADGLTIADLVAGIGIARARDVAALAAAPISVVQQVALHIGDVGALSRGIVPGGCRAAGAMGTAVVLDVYATPDADVSAVRTALAPRVGTLHPQPPGYHIVVGAAHELEPREVIALRDAAIGAGLADVVVVVSDDGVEIDATGGDTALAAAATALRALPFVIGAGDAPLAIRITGEGARAAGRQLAQRFTARNELVATRGLASHAVPSSTLDAHAVAAMGATGIDVAIASESPNGVRAGELTIDGRRLDIRVRVRSGVPGVRARDGIVPATAVAAMHADDEPDVILRSGGRPEVVIEVRAAPSVARAELDAAKLSGVDAVIE